MYALDVRSSQTSTPSWARWWARASLVFTIIGSPVGCIREVSLGHPWPPPGIDGAYVTAVEDCERGCADIVKGSIILAVDGKPVHDAAGVESMGLTDGQAHRLTIRDRQAGQREAIVVAHPQPGRVPSPESSPLRTISTQELARTPELGRHPLLGHASPAIELVDMDSNLLDGSDLYGQRRLIVYWDTDAQRDARAYAIALQQALPRLRARGVDVMFAHIYLPWRPTTLLTTPELLQVRREWGIDAGRADASIRFYRLANVVERGPSRRTGLGNVSVLDSLLETPAIIMLDEDGIVRWDSEDIDSTPEAIIEAAIGFALEVL